MGNAGKHFGPVKTGVFWGSRSCETSGSWPATTEFSRIQLQKSFTVLPDRDGFVRPIRTSPNFRNEPTMFDEL